MAEHEESTWKQAIEQHPENSASRVLSEVDEHVAAKDGVSLPVEFLVSDVEHVCLFKSAHGSQLRTDNAPRVGGLEVLFSTYGGGCPEGAFGIDAASGGGDSLVR